MELYKNSLWKDVDFNSIIKSIPTDWNTLSVGKIIDNNPKSKIKAGDAKKNGPYPFFNCSEIQTKYIDNSLIDGENIFITTGGDFMFNLYFNGESSYSTDVWSIKIKEHNTKFIHYFLKYNFETNQQYFRGFKFKHLDKKGFQKMVLPIPSSEEQNSIVSVLSYQENIIESTKELIKNIDKRNQFMIDELLSGRLRIKEIENGKIKFYKNSHNNWKNVEINGENLNIPKDWVTKKIKEISSVVTGNTPSTKNKDFWGNIDGIKWISTPNLYKTDNGYIKSNTRFLTLLGSKKARICPPETLLVSCIATIGELGLLNEHAAFNQQINAILPNVILNNKYIRYYLIKNKQKFINFASKSVVSIMSKKLFESFEIYFPSLQKEQDLMINFLELISLEIQKYEKILIQEEKKFEFLLEELMSGRLRVKV